MGKVVTEASNYISQINNWKLALSFKLKENNGYKNAYVITLYVYFYFMTIGVIQWSQYMGKIGKSPDSSQILIQKSVINISLKICEVTIVFLCDGNAS